MTLSRNLEKQINHKGDEFRTWSNICEGGFLRNWFKAQNRKLFSQKNSIAEFWRSPKSESQYLAHNNQFNWFWLILSFVIIFHLFSFLSCLFFLILLYFNIFVFTYYWEKNNECTISTSYCRLPAMPLSTIEKYVSSKILVLALML